MNYSAGQPLRLEIRGLGPVPSFKNAKRIVGLRPVPGQRFLWRGFPLLATEKKAKKWMKQAIASIASQLCSVFQINGSGITPECLRQSVTASLPHDDNWQALEIGSVKTVLVPKGEEGADIIIERL